MKINIENGEIKIDIYELLEELTSEKVGEEQLGEMFNALCWHHSAYKELIGTARNTFVADNMNVEFYKLFKDFFIFPDGYGNEPKSDIVRRMAQVMRQVLKDNAKEKVVARLARNAPFKIFKWLEANYGTDDAWKIRSALLDAMKDEDGKSIYKISDDMVEQTPYQEFVEEWVDAVYKMLSSDE